jgi:hypothetical protein
MQGSLFWIEWLDRLDRVLTSTREDILSLSRMVNPRSLAVIERSQRQLSALTNDLRLLDRDVLGFDASAEPQNGADRLQQALDATVLQLGTLTQVLHANAPAARETVLAAIDSALRDSRYEAAVLLAPSRRLPKPSASLAPRV